MAKAQADLEKLRKEIDALDKALLTTLKKRFQVVEKITIIKNKLKLKTHQKVRWEAMMKARNKLAKTLKLKKKFTHTLFKLIHKESKRIQSLKNRGDK